MAGSASPTSHVTLWGAAPRNFAHIIDPLCPNATSCNCHIEETDSDIDIRPACRLEQDGARLKCCRRRPRRGPRPTLHQHGLEWEHLKWRAAHPAVERVSQQRCGRAGALPYHLSTRGTSHVRVGIKLNQCVSHAALTSSKQ